ncbi:MAG: J domain-containing protein [Thermodesulfobacteriota bacterium]
MNIRQAFYLLDLKPGVTEAEAKQAYKDIVSVWHPDRFSNNPRLRQKAEQKLKEINLAYETVCTFLAPPGGTKGASQRTASETGPNFSEMHPGSTGTFDHRSKTEMAAELGTGVVLGLYAFLSKRLRDFLME